MKGGLSKEVVSDEGEVSMGYIYFCNQKDRSYKRGGLLRGWSLKRGTTVHTYVRLCNNDKGQIHNYIILMGVFIR